MWYYNIVTVVTLNHAIISLPCYHVYKLGLCLTLYVEDLDSHVLHLTFSPTRVLLMFSTTRCCSGCSHRLFSLVVERYYRVTFKFLLSEDSPTVVVGPGEEVRRLLDPTGRNLRKGVDSSVYTTTRVEPLTRWDVLSSLVTMTLQPW